MSIRPGSRIASPRSISSPSGVTADTDDPVAVDLQDAGPHDLTGVDVEQPGGLERQHRLDHRLPDQLDPGRAAVGDARLLPRLDRKRHHDQRLHDVHEGPCVLGQVVQRELVAVGDHVVQAGERDVVERLHLGHRRGQPLGVALGFGGQVPIQIGLQVGEFSGQRHCLWYSFT